MWTVDVVRNAREKRDFLRCGGQARTVSAVDVTAVRGSQLTYCVEVAAELLADVEEQTVRSVHQAPAARVRMSPQTGRPGLQPTFRTSDPSFLRISILPSNTTVWTGWATEGRLPEREAGGSRSPPRAGCQPDPPVSRRLGRCPPHYDASLGSVPSFPSRQVLPRCPSPRPRTSRILQLAGLDVSVPERKPQKVSPRQTHAHSAATS